MLVYWSLPGKLECDLKCVVLLLRCVGVVCFVVMLRLCSFGFSWVFVWCLDFVGLIVSYVVDFVSSGWCFLGI